MDHSSSYIGEAELIQAWRSDRAESAAGEKRSSKGDRKGRGRGISQHSPRGRIARDARRGRTLGHCPRGTVLEVEHTGVTGQSLGHVDWTAICIG